MSLLEVWEQVTGLVQQAYRGNVMLVFPEGEIIAGKQGLCDFCRYIQSSQVGYQRCQRSRREHCAQAATAPEGQLIRECHAGVRTIAVPLKLPEGLLGTLVTGHCQVQIPTSNHWRRLAEEIGLDPAELLSRYQTLPRFSDTELEAWGRILQPYAESLVEIVHRYSTLLRHERTVSTLLQQRDELQIHDELTKVFNARYLQGRLSEELERAGRYGHPLSLVLVDVNDFSKLNENYGYPVGDAVLRELARILTGTVRRVDLVARLGQDDFAILLPEANYHQAYGLAQRLLRKVKEYRFGLEHGETLPLEITLGIATSKEEEVSPEDFLERASRALQEAREENQPVHIFAPPSNIPRTRIPRRVVVTGIGIITPIGIGKEEFWKGVKAGRSGITHITFFDPDGLPCKIGGEVRNFHPEEIIDPRTLKRSGRSSHLAIVAAKMAVEDAGLLLEEEDPERVGVVLGCAVGGIEFAEQEHAALLLGRSKKVSPYLAINIFAGAVSSEVSRFFGVKGPSLTISTGCAAGNDAIGRAAESIRNGETDVVITGGAEAPMRPMIMGSFCSMHALSLRNDDPTHASRPFDRERDGFVMSEGAGILILEELQHALQRGAHIYGEIVGYAATGDAFHMARPDPDGEAAAKAIEEALASARLAPQEVDYINAHGSSTPLNDKTETAVIHKVFGKHAYNLAVSSTKSMVGHPIGASGGVELIATLLGMERGLIPPTINYEFEDPECDLDYVPNEPRPGCINVAVSNSFGFGGKNAILVVQRY